MPTPPRQRWRARIGAAAEPAQTAMSTTIAEFAARALVADNLEEVLDDAVRVAASVLQVPLGSMFTLTRDGEELFWAAGVGWTPGVVRQTSVSAIEGSLCSVALANRALAHSADLRVEERFQVNEILAAHGAVSGLSMPLVLRGVPYGTLTIFDQKTRDFTAAEQAALSLLGSIVAAAVARAEADAALLMHGMTDPLTGLANRALFHDRTTVALRRAAPRRLVAVVLADIDAFKLVNDSHGHSVGDELLAAIAPRLVAALPPEATVARLGGDEFVVCVDGVRDVEQAYSTGAHVAAALNGRVVVTGRELFVTASVGVAVTDRRNVTSGELLRQADVAMYRAKELGRGQVEIFDQPLRSRVADRLSLETELMRAVENDDFTLAYQPLVELGTGAVRGVEALLRWTHPEQGPISPAIFVPVLEDCGLINVVGHRSMVDACAQMIRWQAHVPDLHLALNVSARQLGRPELVEAVVKAYADGLTPATLCIEVTETALIDSTVDARGYLQRLRDAGACVVLDDFGTGYSSLSHLMNFPLDMIKIDRSFLAGLGVERKQTAITEAVVPLAHRLSLKVVAEGVETEEQRRLVTELGCDYGQGFLWARPMAPPEATTYLTEGQESRRTS